MRMDYDLTEGDADWGLTKSEEAKYEAIYGGTLTDELAFMGELAPLHTDCGLVDCRVTDGVGSKCGMKACPSCGLTIAGDECVCQKEKRGELGA